MPSAPSSAERPSLSRWLKFSTLDRTSVLGVDEKSFQGREFVTVVCDLADGTVLHIADVRGNDALKKCYAAMTPAQPDAVQAVAMDMHRPYVLATESALPEATIVFDKFHIAKLAGEAVDQARRQEAKCQVRAFMWLSAKQASARLLATVLPPCCSAMT